MQVCARRFKKNTKPPWVCATKSSRILTYLQLLRKAHNQGPCHSSNKQKRGRGRGKKALLKRFSKTTMLLLTPQRVALSIKWQYWIKVSFCSASKIGSGCHTLNKFKGSPRAKNARDVPLRCTRCPRRLVAGKTYDTFLSLSSFLFLAGRVTAVQMQAKVKAEWTEKEVLCGGGNVF